MNDVGNARVLRTEHGLSADGPNFQTRIAHLRSSLDVQTYLRGCDRVRAAIQKVRIRATGIPREDKGVKKAKPTR